MKRLVLAACAAVLALGLAACSGGASSGAASASGSAAASSAAASTAAASSEAASSAAASSAAASAASSAAAAGLQDYGWIAFEMPEGWVDANESDKYETIANSANNRQMMKFMVNSLSSSFPTAADKAADDIGKEFNHYTDAGKQTIGGYEWSLASFEFNGNPSVVAYTDIADKRCLKVTIYEIGIDDPATQTVLSSITINKDELW